MSMSLEDSHLSNPNEGANVGSPVELMSHSDFCPQIIDQHIGRKSPLNVESGFVPSRELTITVLPVNP